MHKDYMDIAGVRYRVELNWNAIVSFLAKSGKDDMSALADFRLLKPSDLAGLLLAGMEEGARLDGQSLSLTVEDVGASIGMTEMAAFLEIFNRQMQPQVSGEAEGAKKKD